MKNPKRVAGKSWSKQQHSYAVAQVGVSRERSTFMRPSRTLTAIDGSFIYPILVDEVLPGDTFQVSVGIVGRLATPIRPFMDNLYIDTFYFFIPNRLVWDNWQKFQGEKDNPGDSSDFMIPQIPILGGTVGGKLSDYMGIPTTYSGSFDVSALPFRGYNLVYNEYFRDTNLQDSVVEDKGDADSTEANHVLLKRGKRKDYITGCLPWPQRPGVGLTPGIITGTVPVTATAANDPSFDVGGETDRTLVSFGGTNAANWSESIAGSSDAVWNTTGLEADLDTAQANTINQLRQSIAIQQLLELDARGGARYREQLQARFGVTTPDFRLQRPEYLGGGHMVMGVQQVSATAFNTAEQIDVADQHAYGHVAGSAGGFTHSFTEHGFVLGLVNVRADYTYFEGTPRFWNRLTRYDFYEPALAHLGEQSVLNQEVYTKNDGTTNDLLTFGYQERFSEYKYGNSMTTSLMRPNADDTIAIWNLAEEFGSLPTLNAAFIVDNPPIDRVVQVPSQPNVILDCYFQNRCTRVMPVFNTPGLTRL